MGCTSYQLLKKVAKDKHTKLIQQGLSLERDDVNW